MKQCAAGDQYEYHCYSGCIACVTLQYVEGWSLVVVNGVAVLLKMQQDFDYLVHHTVLLALAEVLSNPSYSQPQTCIKHTIFESCAGALQHSLTYSRRQ